MNCHRRLILVQEQVGDRRLTPRRIRRRIEALRPRQFSGAVSPRQRTPAGGTNSTVILGGIRGEGTQLRTANCFGMMVARDGVEPPTPAFSELG